MTTSFRRFLVFQAFLLWQGGFLFYTAVVVPIGTDVLGSAADQGFITRRVTDWLNLFGVVWAVLFAWDAAADPDPVRRRRRARWVGWAVAVGLLAALAWLHRDMDALLDPDEWKVRDRRAFQTLHIVYLWLSTAHWVLGLVLAWLTLRAWTHPESPRTAVRGLSPAPTIPGPPPRG